MVGKGTSVQIYLLMKGNSTEHYQLAADNLRSLNCSHLQLILQAYNILLNTRTHTISSSQHLPQRNSGYARTSLPKPHLHRTCFNSSLLSIKYFHTIELHVTQYCTRWQMYKTVVRTWRNTAAVLRKIALHLRNR